jgi:hypothetical protein
MVFREFYVLLAVVLCLVMEVVVDAVLWMWMETMVLDR